MIRFRYRGWGWKVCEPVKAIGQQVEAAWPERQPADGTLAGGSHAKWPASDHGKDPNGIVRAIDIGQHDDAELDDFCEQLRLARDPRLRYLINDRKMFSSYPRHGYPAWTWRPYTGTNPHSGHAHLSMERDPAVDQDGRPFAVTFPGEEDPDMPLLPVEYGHGFAEPENLTNPPSALTGSQAFKKEDVRLIQYLAGLEGDDVDGLYGTGTAQALADTLGGGDPVFLVDAHLYLALQSHDHPTLDHRHGGGRTGGVIRE